MYRKMEVNNMEKEYIIKNISKEEYELLENSDIDWCPDEMFTANHDAVVFSEEEYSRAMKLLGRIKI